MQKTLSSPIFLSVLALMGLGLVQVYSSSYIYAIEGFGNGLFFFQKQVFFTLASILVLLLASQIPYHHLRSWFWAVWIFAGFSLLLTFIPGLGVRVGGAVRWLRLPMGFRLEPSELLKVSLSLFVAGLTIRSETPMGKVPLGVLLLLLVLPLVLLLQQPDFGAFVILSAVILIYLFVYGLRWRYIVATVALTLPAFYFLVMNVPYRRARVLAFLDPWSDPEQKGFQVIQSLISFSSGGFWGVGLGQGQGKLFFLPEAHTDFTLAVFGEETGFLGFVCLMGLYGFLMFKGLQLSTRARDPFARSLALGLTATFGLNVVVNVGVALGIVPPKGLTLPFLSYGGSSLMAMAALFGLLMNIDNNQRT
ncbi:MAG: putative lipid II flippase FtsW [Bdellovibrio sp.]|nr:MAG: putative lipid II flippase FtsW [Bdellovibrio sp.]